MAITRPRAECFPVGEYIREEMEARGWDIYDVADRMGDGEERSVWALTVELLVHCSDQPDVVLGQETANALSRAFGTSAEFWQNLHAAWVDSISKATLQASKRGG